MKRDRDREGLSVLLLSKKPKIMYFCLLICRSKKVDIPNDDFQKDLQVLLSIYD